MEVKLLAASDKNIAALKKAAALGSSGFHFDDAEKDLTFPNEEEQESNSSTSSSGEVLVKINSKITDLYYNVTVYPNGINGEDTYSAKLFFGDKCWTSDIPLNTYLIANSISVFKVEEGE